MVVSSFIRAKNIISPSLEYCTNYYWKVVAKDSYGVETVGPTWQFSTYCGPKASITADETFGRYPLTVHLQAQAQADSGLSIVSYDWDFGDAGMPSCSNPTSNESNPIRTYGNPGTYTVCLRARDSAGLVGDWSTMGINITANVGYEFAARTGADGSDSLAVGFNNVDKHYLIVWGEGDGTVNHPNEDLYAKIMAPSPSGDGMILVKDRFPVTQAIEKQYEPAVAFDGERYLVIWATNAGSRTCGSTVGSDYNIRGRFFNRNGDPYGAEFNIAEKGCEGSSLIKEFSPRVAYAGKYLVTWYRVAWTGSENDRLVSGAALVTPPVAPGDAPIVSPSFNLNLPMQTYSDTGKPTGTLWPNVSTDGTSFLVVSGADCHESGNCQLFGLRIDVNGNQDPPFVISSHFGNGIWGTGGRASLAYNPVNRYYLVVFTSALPGGVFVALVDPLSPSKVLQGPLELANRFNSTATECYPQGFCETVWTHIEQKPVVAFDGLHFLVAWLDGCRNYVLGHQWRQCPDNQPEEIRGFRLLAHPTSIEFLDDPAVFGIPISCTGVSSPECSGGRARPFGPTIEAAPGPTSISQSITPNTFNMFIMWPDARSATKTYLGSSILNGRRWAYNNLQAWGVLTHAATPDVQPLIPPTPPPSDPIPGIDLSIGGFSFSPLNMKSGTPITITSTIRNNGTQSAGAFDVRYYWSASLPVTSGSVVSTQTFSNGLGGGAALTETFAVTPPASGNGTYYLGVVADLAAQVREADESNNISLFSIVIDGTSPVSTIEYPKNGQRISGQVGVTAIAQDGTGVQKIEFYLDGTLAFSDTLGTDTRWLWSWDTATVTEGSHTLSVKAYDTIGNASMSPTITVQVDRTPPIISNVTSSGLTSSSVNISWTTNETSGSIVEYGVSTSYGSSSPADTTLVTNHSVSLSGLSPSTLFHYRVKSRDAAGNIVTSGDFTFATASSSGPDLTMLTVGATVSGSNLTINDVVRNMGSASAGAFNVGFYLSADTTYQGTDTFLCQRSITGLAAGTSNPTSGTATTTCSISTVTPDLYYIIGRADSGASVTETNETNNTLSSSQVAIGPDLIVSLISASKSSNTLTINNAVKNQGNATAGASEISFYLSTDQTLSTASDTFVCKRSITSLNAGASNPTSGTATTTCTIPAVPAGSYYVIGFADSAAAITEARENNNTQTGALITIP
jgi:hypothetical protein